MADARKTLPVLRKEWEGCTKCELGVRRDANGGQLVFGEGKRRGVMFIGEGPGSEEEAEGTPFVGPSGKILRGIIQKLGFTEYYITNIVTCRSCAPLTDAAGTLILRRGRPVFKDEPPIPPYIEACQPRLHEEIYLVDPIVIVSLGGTAAKTLIGGNLSILNEAGKERHIEIPGATARAVLTETKKQWVRKVGGKIIQPVERNTVRYLLVPTIHPAYVARNIADRGLNSPMRQLFNHIKLAVQIYERYLLETFGTLPTGASDVDYTEGSFDPDEEDNHE